MSNDESSPVNPTVTAADQVIEALENLLVPIAEDAIIAAAPDLGIPIVKQITEAIEQALADKLTALAQIGVTFAVIDTQVMIEKFTISQALTNLIEAERSGDTSAIKKAIQDYANANSQLVSASGTLKH